MRPVRNSLFAALFFIAPLTAALFFDGPKATGLINGHEINTDHYRLPTVPLQTAAPNIEHAALFKRDHYETLLIGPDNTCGYFNGNSTSRYTCVSTNYRCNFYLSYYSTESTSVGVRACCPSTGVCNAYLVTACINSKDYYAGTTCSDSLGGCVVCTSSSYPYCNGATFPALGVKDYLCGFSTYNVFQTASLTYLNQFPDRLYITSSYLAPDLTTSTTSSSSTSKSTSSTTPTPTPTPTPSPSPTPTPTPTPVPDNSGPPIGPIVGGVVGGVAVIAGIIALIWFMRRRQKRRANANQPGPEVQQQVQQFPPPTDPKAPYVQQTPVQPPYYQQQPGYQQQVPYYQQPGEPQQQTYNYGQPGQQYPPQGQPYVPVQPYAQGQQYPQHQQYSAHPTEHDAATTVGGTSPVPLDKTPTETLGTNRLSQAPTAPTSPNPTSQHSPNPQHSPRQQEAFEIEA